MKLGTSIRFPSLAEQEKVGDFFVTLDELIGAKKAELEKRRQIKAALLEVMFPDEEGSTDSQSDEALKGALGAFPELELRPATPHSPRLRFRGFTDDWQREKLGDALYLDISHNSLSRNELTTVEKEVRNIHYGDILINFSTVVDCRHDAIPFINDENFFPDSNSLLKNGDIVFADTAEDSTAGKAIEICSSPDDIIVAGLHTIAGRPVNRFGSYFLGYYLNSNSYRRQIIPILQGTKVLSISKGAIAETYFSFPSLAEQERIGEFFRAQDESIAALREQIDKLRTIKQACLEQMFV